MNVLNGEYIHCILHAGSNVLLFQLRIVVGNDFCKRDPLADKLQHVANRNPCAAYARLPEVNVRIDENAVKHESDSNPRILPAPGSGWVAAACGRLWLRSGGCAHG